jgi:hypothetical protein
VRTSAKSHAAGGKKKGTAKKKSKVAPDAVKPREPDILDPPAMYNLYYTAHNVPHALQQRNFAWPSAPKGKKKRKGKKK